MALYGIAIAVLPRSKQDLSKPDSNELRVWNDGWKKPEAGAKLLCLEDARDAARAANENTLNTDYIVRSVIVNVRAASTDFAKKRLDKLEEQLKLIDGYFAAQGAVGAKDHEAVQTALQCVRDLRSQ